MRYSRHVALLVFGLSVALGAGGCLSSSSKSDKSESQSEEGESPTMAGNWKGNINPDFPFTLKLAADGDTFSGTYTAAGESGTVTGSTSGNNVVMTIAIQGGGAVAEFKGSVNAERTSMSGTYKIISGGGGNGSWSAAKL